MAPAATDENKRENGRARGDVNRSLKAIQANEVINEKWQIIKKIAKVKSENDTMM